MRSLNQKLVSPIRSLFFLFSAFLQVPLTHAEQAKPSRIPAADRKTSGKSRQTVIAELHKKARASGLGEISAETYSHNSPAKMILAAQFVSMAVDLFDLVKKHPDQFGQDTAEKLAKVLKETHIEDTEHEDIYTSTRKKNRMEIFLSDFAGIANTDRKTAYMMVYSAYMDKAGENPEQNMKAGATAGAMLAGQGR